MNQWSVSAWLMLASAMWSLIVAWQLVASSGDPALATEEGPPWLLTLAALAAGVSSAAAFWMLRRGTLARVRVPIIIAAVCGAFAIFSTVASVASLWLVRRARR